MNFIKHYIEVMDKISMDDRLHATHVSLYVSLFTLWNINRFENPISINREEVMRISKIGSKHTYHKCLRNLHEFGYINYNPSNNPLRGSLVYLFNFGTSNEPVVKQSRGKNGTSSEQVLHPSINSINITNSKHLLNKKAIPKKEEVIQFFKTENYPEKEGLKFYNHFQSVGWKKGKDKSIEDWHAAAHNWMLNSKHFEKPKPQKAGNLHTLQNKNYGEPL